MKSKLFNIILSIACGLSFATSIVSVSLSAVNNTAPITEEVKTINSTLVDLKALDTTLDGKIVSLETKVTSLEEELTETNASITSLGTSIDSKLSEMKTELEGKITALETDISSLKAKDTELEAKILELEEALDSSVGQIQSWVTSNYATIESCETLESEIKALITSIESRVDALETSIETLSTAVDTLQDQVNRHEEEIDDLTTRVNCLEGKHVWVNGVCENCETNCDHTEFTFIDNGNGTHKKDCVCDHDEDLNHTLVYTADDEANTITESCSDGCGYSSVITLKAPTGSLIYNGNRQEATVDGTIIGEYEITYNDEPIYVASYVATLTVGNVSVSVEYSIIQDPATGGFDGEWITF